MFRLLILLLLADLTRPITAEAQTHSESLPPHQVASDTPLAPKKGRRIEIHVRDSNLTKEQCKALIAHYSGKAAPNGQVSVRKPSTLFGGVLQPWCVENFDEQGVSFNDSLFR